MPRLEHVGIAVDDAADAVRILADLLGETPYLVETLDSDRLRTHFIWGGAAKLELLEELDAESPVGRFLARRGPGLHHIAFEVPDIHAMHARVRDMGYEPVDPEPRAGADGKLIFFLHPRATGGVLIEFCQSADSPLKTLDVSRTAPHRTLVAPGSSARPSIVCLGTGEPRFDLQGLVRRLSPDRAVYSVRADSGLDLPAVLDLPESQRCHIVADTAAVRPALAVADDVRIRSFVLVDPDHQDARLLADVSLPVLVVTSDGEAERRSVAALRTGPRAPTTAAVADFALRTAVIAAYVEGL